MEVKIRSAADAASRLLAVDDRPAKEAQTLARKRPGESLQALLARCQKHARDVSADIALADDELSAAQEQLQRLDGQRTANDRGNASLRAQIAGLERRISLNNFYTLTAVETTAEIEAWIDRTAGYREAGETRLAQWQSLVGRASSTADYRLMDRDVLQLVMGWCGPRARACLAGSCRLATESFRGGAALNLWERGRTGLWTWLRCCAHLVADDRTPTKVARAAEAVWWAVPQEVRQYCLSREAVAAPVSRADYPPATVRQGHRAEGAVARAARLTSRVLLHRRKLDGGLASGPTLAGPWVDAFGEVARLADIGQPV